MVTRVLTWLRAFIWGVSILYALSCWVLFAGRLVLIISGYGSLLLQGASPGERGAIGIAGTILFLVSLSIVFFNKFLPLGEIQADCGR